MKKVLLTLSAGLLALAASTWAGEIGFIEDFAIKDRDAAIKQLIPGTEDYYYFQCLQAQNRGDLDKVGPLLTPWVQRHGRTDRVVEIENRQALLGYNKDPQGSLNFLKDRLGLTFAHQRETLEQAAKLPMKLDTELIGVPNLSKRAMELHGNSLDGFDAPAMEFLMSAKLGGDQRRNLLARLDRPDYPNLVQMIEDDFNFPHTGGFGSLPIHGKLLKVQLDELLKLRPGLLNDVNFVNAYCARLRPGADTDVQRDIKARLDYLDRLWTFVSKLGSAHNSLKANVLYERLALDRSLGVYDKDRFMTYIRLPRSAAYVNPKYLEPAERRDFLVNLGADYRAATLLPPIGNDEALVRAYLEQFFLKEDSYEPYEEFLNSDYLKAVFAETKITAGLGDQEKWASLLTPEQFKALRERVDIDFAPTDKPWFGPDDAVTLDVMVKNVKTLYVKVYEVNSVNYFRKMGKQVDASINLDGLVANMEQQEEYKDPPLLRVKRTFKFDKLSKRGIYVVDFIGNGKASRAVIQKGQLHYISQVGPAGMEIAVLDEAGRKLDKAGVVIGEHEFTADGDGVVRVPFSTEPGVKPLILVNDGFASLDSFDHKGKQYGLDVGFHVEREALIKRAKAAVIIRPRLTLTGKHIPIGLLEQPMLTIDTMDREGIATSKQVPMAGLSDLHEGRYEFQVPENLVRINFKLTGQVTSLVTSKKIDLASHVDTFPLNTIDLSDKVEDLFFSCADGKYFIDVLGKSGEARPSRPVNLKIKHEAFRDPFDVTLQSDAKGRIELSALTGIHDIAAVTQDGLSRAQFMPRDLHTMVPIITARAGMVIQVPYMGKQKEPAASAFSLLEVRDGAFVADWLKAVKLSWGMLNIAGLPPGDYSLFFKETQEGYTLKVTAGDKMVVLGGGAANAATQPVAKAATTAVATRPATTQSSIAGGDEFLVGAARYLQVVNPAPLQIERIEADKDNLRIILRNATTLTRVHLSAVVYEPQYPLWGDLEIPADQPQVVIPGRLDSSYIASREIGDEVRYILERKFAVKFPGNMLERPSLLLNPWALRKVDTDTLKGVGDAAFAGKGAGLGSRIEPGAAFGPAGRGRSTGPILSNYDFLPQPAAVLVNLAPDKEGVVTVPRKALGAHQQFNVLAIDDKNTVFRQLAVEGQEMQPRDLRLADPLDPKKDFAETRRITLLGKDRADGLTIADVSSSRWETYDHLARAYALYSTLAPSQTLAEFSFILQWPKLTEEQKRQKYSKYACHELNFFLYKKDADFFKKVVAPYIKNKKDKTFLDRYLTGEDLSAYMGPWQYSRLNTVEQILLAQRIKDEPARTARLVKDRYDLIPVDLDRLEFLFRTAIKVGALEPAIGFGNMLGVQPPAPMTRPAKAGEAAAARPAPSDVDVEAKADLLVMKSKNEEAKELQKDLKDATEQLDKLQKKADDIVEFTDGGLTNGLALDSAKRQREKAAKFYRKLDKTEEWVENNYCHLPIAAQNADLVKVNGFWKDYAKHDGPTPFISSNMAEAAGSFTEIILALSVLDLPFEAPRTEAKLDGVKLALPAETAVVYHKEILPAAPAANKTPILVSQNFFRKDDRYTYDANEKIDKFVTDEFLTHVVYGCQVVVTNPTSSRQKLDLLLQIPAGAMPVENSLVTRSLSAQLEPFSTKAVEYYFYFPSVGDFVHYPVHVTSKGATVAAAPAVMCKVVAKPSKVDTTSWDYISQNGTSEQVIQYLKDNNVLRVNLDRIAWRMTDADFLKTVTGLLRERHIYNDTLWSYGIKHNVPGLIREYLPHHDDFVARCGLYIDTPLLAIDPVERKAYQHVEYAPLVNSRAHKFGQHWQIANESLLAQYQRLMKVLSYRPALDDEDNLSITYYLLLQDRVEEAFDCLAKVDPKKLPEQVQYDYLQAYMGFFHDSDGPVERIAKWNVRDAREIADKYKEFPVERWRNMFAAVGSQLDEIQGKGGKVADAQSREQVQGQLAAGAPGLDFTVEDRQVKLTYQNVNSVRVNYYLMDLELLFSRNPFVQQYSQDLFSFIQPNLSEDIALKADEKARTFEIPKKFHTSNVMVEIVSGGVRRSQAYFAHSMAVQVIENFGQLKVTDDKQAPLAKVYVKVYARMKGGGVEFYKDGYTDLRGRFDYASLSTTQQDNVERFSMLIMSDTHGAVLREAKPPSQ